MTIYGWDGGIRRTIVDPKVWAAGGRKDVSRVWQYQSGARSLIYARPNFSASGYNLSQDSQRIQWSGPTGPVGSYVIWNAPITVWYATVPGTSTYWDRGGLAPSTYYDYTVGAFEGPPGAEGPMMLQSNAFGMTTPAPAVTYQTREVYLTADWSQSYRSNGGQNVKRTDTKGNEYLYSGNYDSTYGTQRSLCHFPIPGDVRNCHQIQQISFSIYNLHAYWNSGATYKLALHHYPTKPAGFGSTGSYQDIKGPKPGWCNNAEWFGFTSAGWEQFRTGGAWGIAFTTAGSQDNYGYAQGATAGNRPRMYIRYVVQV